MLGPAEVAVGPGVFVSRPETEGLFVLALAALEGRTAPVVVDLCTGSGAIALAIALMRTDAVVHAVENDPAALSWASRNLAGITVHDADVTTPGVLEALAGTVDVVVSNPPYVPDSTVVSPEVRLDPPQAVFAGPDGLAVIRPLAHLAHRLLTGGECSPWSTTTRMCPVSSPPSTTRASPTPSPTPTSPGARGSPQRSGLTPRPHPTITGWYRVVSGLYQPVTAGRGRASRRRS